MELTEQNQDLGWKSGIIHVSPEYVKNENAHTATYMVNMEAF